MKKIQLKISQLLVAMTVLVLLFMLVLSLVGLRNVGSLTESIEFVAKTGQAVRVQMDADMMHDTIRSDVLGVVLASRDGNREKLQEIEKELNDHVARFNKNLAENSKAGLGVAANQQVVSITPVVNEYSNQAQKIAKEAIQSGRVEIKSMATFTKNFEVLEVEMEKLGDLIQAEAELAKNAAAEKSSDSRVATLLIMSIALVFFSIFAWYVFRRIAYPLANLAKVSLDINLTGNFSLRAAIQSEDEIGNVAAAFNGMIDSVQRALNDINGVMGSVAKGDFNKRVKAEVRGDLNSLKENVNESVDELQVTMVALNGLIKAMSEGDFGKRVNVNVEGELRIAIDHSIHSMQTMETMIGEIGQVMAGVAQGDITMRVCTEGLGGFGKLKDHVNQSLDALGCLNDIMFLANGLAKGDLTQTISSHYPGTFGIVSEAMNGTSENLKGLVSEIRAATDAINNAAKEIASGNNDLSNRTEEQASSLQETAASMNELTSTVQQNTENAKRANQLAIGAADVASKGVKVVNEVVFTMDSINQSSRKITEIISVIDGIAFQTNILALNAAVEAARAGEQGRGFAVVAGEVRNLAQRAAAAAGEIKGLIGSSEEKVSVGSKLVIQAGQTMQEIVNSIQNVTTIVSEISAASIEQNSGIAQVNQAIRQMDEVTQQNAALVEQAAASAESLEEQAENLSYNVAKFKIGETSQRGVSTQQKALRPKEMETYQIKPVVSPSQSQTLSGDDWEEF